MKLAALFLCALPFASQGQVCEPPQGPHMSQKDPASAESLFLAGQYFTGKNTPKAIEEFDQALAADPSYAVAHLSLVTIYKAPNFLDAEKARAHLEAFQKACPEELSAYRHLERMPTSDFLRSRVTGMRALLEKSDAQTALPHYRVLWTLEFQVAPPNEFAQVRERIQKDLERLRALDLASHPALASTLREGYKLAEDKDGLAWIDAKFPPPATATHANEPMEASQAWQKAHPYPTLKTNPTDFMAANQERNKAQLEATAEWIAKWPDNEFVWSQRLQAMFAAREISDAEVESAAANALKVHKPGGIPPHFQIATLYRQRNIHTAELPEIIKKGLAELDQQPESPMPASDLYPPSRSANSTRFYGKMSGLGNLADVYLDSGQLELAGNALDEMKTVLDANKSAKIPNWKMSDGQYWDKKARIAEKRGRKLDALTYYQNEIRDAAVPSMADHVAKKAKTLWTDLGGTEETWAIWNNSAPAETPKKVETAKTQDNWEQINKPLPEFELVDMNGKTWRLADLRGKTTLINLWATWCGPCLQELPELEQLYEKLKDRPDVRIITLNTDDNAGLIDPFLKEHKFTFPVLPARALVAQLVPELSIPRNWIVDREGVMRLESVGYGVGFGNMIDYFTKKIDLIANASNP